MDREPVEADINGSNVFSFLQVPGKRQAAAYWTKGKHNHRMMSLLLALNIHNYPLDKCVQRRKKCICCLKKKSAV